MEPRHRRLDIDALREDWINLTGSGPWPDQDTRADSRIMNAFPVLLKELESVRKLVSIYFEADEPEGPPSASRTLLAIRDILQVDYGTR